MIPTSQLYPAEFTEPAQTPTQPGPEGTGIGLAATYFDDMGLTGPSIQRIDPQINFDWQGGSPAPEISPDTYSARWEGQLEPRYSEMYTLYTTGDDGIRLERARPAVVPVILGYLPPGEEQAPHHPQRQHRQHPHPEKEQPVHTAT